MSLKQQLSSNLIGHWDFRTGSIQDYSSSDNDGTFNNSPFWTNTKMGKALYFNQSNEWITIGDVSELNFGSSTDFTLATWVRTTNTSDFLTILGKKNHYGVTEGFAFALQGDRVRVYISDNTTQVTLASAAGVSDGEWHFVCATADRDGNVQMYVDGIQSGSSGALGAVGDMDNAEGAAIGNLKTSSASSPHSGPLTEILVFDIALTEAQISQLYQESLQEAVLTSIPKTTVLPQLLAYGEFERDLIWTKGTGWSISGGKASCDGSQVSVSDLKQTIGTVGETYTIEYQVSGYSAGNVTGLAGDATGSARSADGVYFDRIIATSDGDLGLQADANFVGDIEYVKVGIGDGRVLLNLLGDDLEVSDADVTSDFIENSGFQRITGNWQVDDSGEEKQLTCISASGSAYALQPYAYGTWEFDVNKADASSTHTLFIADTIGFRTDANQDGYTLDIDSSEAILLQEMTGGGLATKAKSANGIVTAGSYTRIRITRSASGEFTIYHSSDSGASWTQMVASGGGSNPFTDTTVTTSSYFVVDYDANDAIKNFKFYPTVIDPTA